MPLEFLGRLPVPPTISIDTVTTAPDTQRAQSGPRVTLYALKPLAGRTAGDVEAHVALEVGPDKPFDDFGRVSLGSLMMAILKNAEYSIDKGPEDKNKFSLKVVYSPKYDNRVVERYLAE